MIKRYTINKNKKYPEEDDIYADSNGAFVHYSDYNALLQQYKNIVDYSDGMNIVLKLYPLQKEIKAHKEFIKEIEE